jgi:hypothetical protein
MSGGHPPRLAVMLLRRFLDDNEPLVGDLLEGFSVRQSRLWFWRQVLVALAMRAFQPRDQQSPLGLAERSTFVPADARRKLKPAWQINLSASPLPFIGGHGLAALGVHATLVRPELWWGLLLGMVGGVAIGLTRTIVGRRAALATPANAGRTLFTQRDRLIDLSESNGS